jgi:hypothetical protein
MASYWLVWVLGWDGWLFIARRSNCGNRLETCHRTGWNVIPIFKLVAQTLNWIASLTGFTYNEINIIAYYILLPFVYVALIDRIFRKHVLKIAYVGGWIGVLCFVGDFTAFSDVLFKRSVDFLLLFSAIGLNYVSASVVICVLLPAIALVALAVFALPSLRRKLFARDDKQATAGSME